MGATGNQPSQYAHADSPPRCVAVPAFIGSKASVVYDGSPPVRLRHDRRKLGGEQAEQHAHGRRDRDHWHGGRAQVPERRADAIPVTRIGPARPMTKAPHQLVPFCKPES